MHILITGGFGFIGSHIAENHLKKGHQVHVVDDLSTGNIQNLAPYLNDPNFRYDQADILTWPNIETVSRWADRVYHMAAVVGVYRVLAEPIKVLSTNIAGCERLLRGIASGGWRPQVIIASSSEVYGPSTKPEFAETDDIIIESGAENRWNYAVSKIADEAFGLSYARSMNLPITLVRFFNTVGPRQVGRYGMVLPRFIAQALANEPITVFGTGQQTRSFCDVRDTVQILDSLASNPESGNQIVNVGQNHEISMNDLANLVREKAKSSSSISHISYKEAYGQDYVDIERRKPCLEKLMRLTNYKFVWNLEDTVENLVSLARQNSL